MNNKMAGWMAGVAAFAVLAGGGAAFAVTRAPGTARPAEIAACYLNTTKPGRAVLVHIAASGTCPKGYKKVTWNAQGPMGTAGRKGDTGAPGLSYGFTASSGTNVSFPMANTLYTVLTSPGAPVSGEYYVSASLTISIAAGNEVGCYSPQQDSTVINTASAGSSIGQYVTIAADFTVTLNTGGTITIDCEGGLTQSGQFVNGTLNAVLIDSSISGANTTRALLTPLRLPSATRRQR